MIHDQPRRKIWNTVNGTPTTDPRRSGFGAAIEPVPRRPRKRYARHDPRNHIAGDRIRTERANILHILQCCDFAKSLTHLFAMSLKNRSNSLPN